MWVIKPGYFEKKVRGMRQPGLDFGRAVGDWMKGAGLAVTNDCCNYYPTIPLLTVETASTPSETEMENLPLFSLFLTQDGTDFHVFIKVAADEAISLGTNA